MPLATGTSVNQSRIDIAGAISNRSLHLILFPTEQCNFRCLYCYETFRNGRMDRATIDGIKNWLGVRVPELSSLHVSWFGGEPLLALDIIEELSEHILGLAARHNRCRYEADITTNAYNLDVPTFERLRRFNVARYQISFDGPREHHDRKRTLANGGATFDRIWANLLRLKATDHGVTFIVRLHLDRDNFPHIPRFMDEYRQAFGDDPRFKLFFRPLTRLGGVQDASLSTFDEDEGKSAVEEFTRHFESNTLPNKTFNDFPTICYAAKLNSFAIRADGTIEKCTVALDRSFNGVGRIRPNGTLKIDRQKLFRWTRGIESGDKHELFCPMQNICI
jgi:uncharacterized protein